ncbi:MAG: glycerophosphoryl diester phosphodiesterase [Nocardioidaceae bacterium]|jgi:glycerophosphoryl diester phosphodiesterase|nr:glycerophosphoryl diester phosphodiesterase [Nocardioidaceae bacterium]
MRHARTSMVLTVLTVLLGGGLLAAPGAQAVVSGTRSANSTPCTHRLIAAHEGYRAHTDGDTVASQIAAYRIGASLADSDLWVTKDGHIVQMHDNDVSHSTNGTGLVTDMTLRQVLALRTTGHDEPVPTLNDSLAIRTAHQAGRYLMFETKFSFRSTANLRLLAHQISAAGMTHHVIIYSVYLNQLTELKQLDPSLQVWYKPTTVPPVNEVSNLNGVMLQLDQITRHLVKRFHNAGLKVIRQRMSETHAEWKQFVATGADGMMTDFPLKMIRLCRALP